MKHLKRFKINENIELEPKSNWDDYVKELFQKYMELVKRDEVNMEFSYTPGDIIWFFDELQDEIDDSVEIDTWVMETKDYFFGLVKAYGRKHAMIKLSLETEDVDLIFESEDSLWVPEEGDIEDNISRLENKIESIKGEIEKWKKVY
jgi:hypothetical protein